MPEKERSDKGKKRVPVQREPERIMLYIPGHGIGPKIAKQLDKDLEAEKKINPKATYSNVLIKWISEHLGLQL